MFHVTSITTAGKQQDKYTKRQSKHNISPTHTFHHKEERCQTANNGSIPSWFYPATAGKQKISIQIVIVNTPFHQAYLESLHSGNLVWIKVDAFVDTVLEEKLCLDTRTSYKGEGRCRRNEESNSSDELHCGNMWYADEGNDTRPFAWSNQQQDLLWWCCDVVILLWWPSIHHTANCQNWRMCKNFFEGEGKSRRGPYAFR